MFSFLGFRAPRFNFPGVRVPGVRVKGEFQSSVPLLISKVWIQGFFRGFCSRV